MSSVPAAHQDRRVLLTDATEREQANRVLTEIDGRSGRLTFRSNGGDEPLPSQLASILERVLEVMARGGTVTVGSLPEELTTTVAAELLGVSRPTLMKMLRNGTIASHMVGSHHRLRTEDVLAARQQRLSKQRQAFDELRSLEAQLDNS